MMIQGETQPGHTPIPHSVRVMFDLEGITSEAAMDMEWSIERHIARYRTPEGEADFAVRYANACRYDAIISQVSQAEGVPEQLIRAIGMVESNFNPNAISSKGARGIMQLMPITYEEVGVAYDGGRKVLTNLTAGARYMKGLIDDTGSVGFALASYFIGPTRLRKIGKQHGFAGGEGMKGSFFEHAFERETIPAPASEYVSKVMAMMVLLNNPR